MKKIIIFLSAFILVIAGCQKHEWNNLLDDNNTVPPPVITFDSLTEITQISLLGTGIIKVRSDVRVGYLGICYGTSQNPGIDSTKVNAIFSQDAFAFKLKGLKPNTLYYVRAYAIYLLPAAMTRQSTVYSNEVTFKTNSIKFGSVGDIDGNTYKTTQIGSQIWMAENLKVTRFNDGTGILSAPEDSIWRDSRIPAYCWANNDTVNKMIYGALYNYYVIFNAKNICPAGWHVPSHEEMDSVISNLGGGDKAGGILKEEGTSHWKYPNSSASNQLGFSSLPGGIRNGNGQFSGIGSRGFFWLASTFQNSLLIKSESANCYFVDFENYNVGPSGSSVRCMRDSTIR